MKLTLDRQESIRVHPKRHAFEMDYVVAADADGRVTAVKADLLQDTGAYASLGGPVLQRACTHGAGPYKIPNVEILGTGVYTNNPPGGAFRGFGVTQSCFAIESCLNLVAKEAGLTPWEVRWRNACGPGDVLPNGQICDEGTGLKETLLAVKELCEKRPDAGIACAMKNAGIGVGLPDVGRVRLKVEKGKAVIYTSAACMGQGLASVLEQFVAETAGLSWGQIAVAPPDTSNSPNSGTTTASRQTLFTGEAACRAAADLKKDLATATLAELEGKEYYAEFSGVTDPFASDKENPVSHVAYSYATHVVLLDGNGMLEKVVAAHDVGRAINPVQVEAQIEGGVVMGLGFGLTEDFPLKDGEPQVKYGTLGLFKDSKVPPIESVIIEKNPDPKAFGAKGLGEIATIPTAPAVAGAYFNRDGDLPDRAPARGDALQPEEEGMSLEILADDRLRPAGPGALHRHPGQGLGPAPRRVAGCSPAPEGLIAGSVGGGRGEAAALAACRRGPRRRGVPPSSRSRCRGRRPRGRTWSAAASSRILVEPLASPAPYRAALDLVATGERALLVKRVETGETAVLGGSGQWASGDARGRWIPRGRFGPSTPATRRCRGGRPLPRSRPARRRSS